jgi:hypothetical protein
MLYISDHSFGRAVVGGFSSVTSFTSEPMPPPTHTLILSPSFKYTGGFLTNPTPFGVPVRMIEPGSRVVPWERNEIICRTLNMWSLHGSDEQGMEGTLGDVRRCSVLLNSSVDGASEWNILRVGNCSCSYYTRANGVCIVC